MWILAPLFLATSLCAPPAASVPGAAAASPGTAQDEPRAETREREAREREVYQQLLRRYNNDIGSHRFDCRQLNDAGVPREEWPTSPLYDYFPKFVELADAGNGQAQYWVVSNTEHAVEGADERRQLLERMYGMLVRDHASGSYMLDAIEELRRGRKLLGEEYVRATLRAIGENSGVAEIEARALLGEAALWWKNGKPADEQAVAQAVELWQVLVDGYAGTDASKQAANFLFNRTAQAMRNAQHSWIRTVRELREQGVGEEGWPAYPLDAYRGQFEALAHAGHEFSSYRVEVFYPAYEQALRAGIVPALLFISDDTSERFLTLEWPWMDIKFEILQLLFEAYPDEAWIYDEVLKLEAQAQRFDQARYVPLLGTLIERVADPRTRYQAEYVLAKNLETARTLAELERALELYDDIAQNSPVERQRKDAERARREFSWVMPGAEMANFSAKDGEGLDVESVGYRGRILVLYFWGFWSPESVADLPWANGLHAKYAERPLVLLGVNTDTISYRSYAVRSAKAGIEWRNVLDTKRKGPRVALFKVFHFPTAIVVDAQGVIRGRNLDHAGTEALIDALLAEMEAEPARDGDSASLERGLRGRVIFDGPREPLPPLRFTEKQTEGCCAAGHEVDPTDRKRLVDAEGGLANVVVYVEVKDVVVNGSGVEVELDQKDCRFEPHVAVVPVGGTLVVRNSDGVSHNVNMNSRYNGRLNEMMPASTRRNVKVTRADKLTLKCDVHPWMSSHVFVVETPYWALTGSDGRYSIPELPPGEYVARFWHEELGELKSERFRVEAGEAAVLDFAMKPRPKRGGRRKPR